MVSRIHTVAIIAIQIIFFMTAFAVSAQADVKMTVRTQYAITKLSVPDAYFCSDMDKLLFKQNEDAGLVFFDVNLTDMTPTCNHEAYNSSEQRTWHNTIDYAGLTIKGGSAEGLMGSIRFKKSEAYNIFTGEDQQGFKHYREIIYADRSHDFDELLIPPEKYFSHPSILTCRTPESNNPDEAQICTLEQLYNDNLVVKYHFNKLFLDQFKSTELATEEFLKKIIVSQERINSRKIIPFGQKDCPGNVTLIISGVHLRVPRNTDHIYMDKRSRLFGDQHPRYNCEMNLIENVYQVSLNPTKSNSLSVEKEFNEDKDLQKEHDEFNDVISKQKIMSLSDGLKGRITRDYEQYLIPSEKIATLNKQDIFVGCRRQGQLKNCETKYLHLSGLYVTQYFKADSGPEGVLDTVITGAKTIQDMILTNKDN